MVAEPSLKTSRSSSQRRRLTQPEYRERRILKERYKMARSKLPPELRGLLKAVKVLTMGRLEQKKVPAGTLSVKVLPDPSHRRNRENIFGVIDIHFRPRILSRTRRRFTQPATTTS